MKKKNITFKQIYLIYVILLVVAVVIAVIYVNSLLKQYEQMLPEKQVEAAMVELIEEAKSGDFFETYSLSEMKAGRFEEQLDLPKEYLSLYAEGEVTYSSKNIAHEEDELYYVVENNGVCLAEVKLKAVSPMKTKLAVLSFREWETEYVKPFVEAVDYSLTVPEDFSVSINGISLTAKEQGKTSGKQITYTLEQLYLAPEIDIRDENGNQVASQIKDGKILVEYYDYSLTLPSPLSVEVNGEWLEGEALAKNRVKYDIRCLEKPSVRIMDNYGNVVNYDGGDEIPLTNMEIIADDRFTVTVKGESVPTEVVETLPNSEYALLTDYVEKLPQIKRYNIAVLAKEADVVIKNEAGEAVSYEEGKQVLDFTTTVNSFDTVPEQISDEIDVLNLAQSWSLFMSDDKSFSELSPYLIADSYQYQVAVEYATGEDITFTSEHTLMNPAFTENKVERFVWITDTSFSVDISFIKHMRLRTGKQVDDYMNDRFYFVKYDDTDDGKDNPTWKIAGMKEIVDNE